MRSSAAGQGPTVVVGSGSFIARTLAGLPEGASCRFLPHAAATDEGAFQGASCILNCALDPRWRREDCPPGEDLDLRLGALAARQGAHYVMLSSRKVYRPDHQLGAAEDAPLGPADAYGRNKLRAEQGLRDLLGDGLSVLRIGNVIGWEPGRTTFMGTMLSSLRRDGRITLDVSPFVERDFLPAETLARRLAAVMRGRPAGTWNLGSGGATAVGRLALWLIEGFGRGSLTVTSPRMADAFRLDVSALAARLGGDWTPAPPLDEYCRSLGRSLSREMQG
jgi:UDP-glucose 4-epimerase